MASMYIVMPDKRAGGTGEDLSHCLKAVEGMQGCAVKKVFGPATNPQRLLIEATPNAADRLRDAYGSRLIIEPDSPLKILG